MQSVDRMIRRGQFTTLDVMWDEYAKPQSEHIGEEAYPNVPSRYVLTSQLGLCHAADRLTCSPRNVLDQVWPGGTTMTDEGKTREQLLEELGAARARVSELERKESERRPAQESSLGEAEGNADVPYVLTEAHYRVLFESGSDAIFVSRPPDGIVVATNSSAERLLGYSKAEMSILLGADFIAPEVLDATVADWVSQVEEKGEFLIETTWVRKDGQRIPVSIGGKPVMLDGQLHFFVIGRDITERKRAEEELRFSEQRYRSLVEATTAVVWTRDADGGFVVPQPSWEKFTGQPWSEHKGFGWGEKIHPDDIERVLGVWKKACEELSFYETAGRVWSASLKEWREFEARAVPVLEADGSLREWVGVIEDIAERTRTEESLRSSEERFRGIFEHAPIGISVVDPAKGLVLVNPLLCRMLGYTAAEMQDLSLQHLTHPDDMDLEERLTAELLAGESTWFTLEKRYIRKDGSVMWGQLTASVFRDEAGKPTVGYGMVVDISERKRAEKALRESEERFRDLIAQSPVGTAIYAPDGCLTYLNPAQMKMLSVMPEVLERHLGHYNILQDQQVADGGLLPFIERGFAGEPAVLPSFHYNPLELEPSARDSLWVKVLVCPIKDAVGDVREVVLMFEDITEDKQAEEERLSLERQVQQAQKLESLGVLAGGIAHDFNNILTGLLGNADLAISDLPRHSPIRPLLYDIQRAGRRAADLTSQMLAYSGKGRFVVEDIDINALVQDMSSLLDSSISKKVSLSYELSGELPAVRADATQLLQIVLNLVSNASEAVGDKGGLVRVSTDTTECDRAFLDAASADEKLAEGRYVTIEVTDTGSGMDDETKAKVFDPFFTTKFTGRGLGLAAVQGIVRRHNGAILVESEPGKGSTFVVLLPALDHAAEAVAAGTKKENDWHGSGTVLVVDDEEAIRVVASRMLKRFGFSVLMASDGVEAIELFLERHDEIDCVLLDLKMPRMDGEETFNELRRIRNDVCVVLSSGFSEEECTARFSDKGLAGFVQKPYLLDDLREKLRNAVRGGK